MSSTEGDRMGGGGACIEPRWTMEASDCHVAGGGGGACEAPIWTMEPSTDGGIGGGGGGSYDVPR